jgi:MFS family permease
MNQTPKKNGFSLARTFASLTFPNFRLWFGGQLVSLFGTWMQTTALGFYAYQITGSKGFLGGVALAAGLPTLVFMFLGGITADRFPRRRLLVITQTALMFLAFILAGLTFFHVTNPYFLIVIAVLNGIANSFDAPARQAFLLEMVDRHSLTNAIALNSTMFNIATAVGPALGGGAYALFGPAACFLVNGVSFLAVIIALLAMKLPARAARSVSPPAPLKSLLDGFRYTFSEKRISAIIVAAMMVSFFGFSVFALFPAWAVEMLHGNEATNGFLQSARGLGALLAAFLIASRGNFRDRWKWMLAGMLVFPAALMAFSLISLTAVSLAFAALSGFSMMAVFNLANAMLQLRVKDEYRGRVMSIYSLTFFGLAPIGSLIMGAIADVRGIGAQPVIFGSAAILLVFALATLLFMKKIRSADREMEKLWIGRKGTTDNTDEH